MRYVLFPWGVLGLFLLLMNMTFIQSVCSQERWLVDFSMPTAEENGLILMGAGFGEFPQADVQFRKPIPFDNGFIGATDGIGGIITAATGEGVMIFGPLAESDGPALIRCVVRASHAENSIIIASIDESESTFVSTNTPSNGAYFLDAYKRIMTLTLPGQGVFRPLIQVVNLSATETLTVYVDQFEIYTLDTEQFYSPMFLGSEQADPEIISIFPADHYPTPVCVPTGTPVPTLDPNETPTVSPTEIDGATSTSTPTLTPTPTPTIDPSMTPTPTLSEGPANVTENVALDLPANSVSLELVLIPAGSFIMGTSESEVNHDVRDWPEHTVTFTRDFFIGRYEITQAQYQVVMGIDSTEDKTKLNHPVTQVTWYECALFCNRLSEMEGLTSVYDESDWSVDMSADGYRLPTDAEWEYACRAGNRKRFSFGDALSCTDTSRYCATAAPYLWWKGNDTHDNLPSGTKEVGLKNPNPWTLFDMHGGVWEWCLDDWEDPSERDNQVNPLAQNDHTLGLMRGGGWNSLLKYCRSASRFQTSLEARFLYTGFRVARRY